MDTTFIYCVTFGSDGNSERSGGSIRILSQSKDPYCFFSNCSWLNCRSYRHGGALSQPKYVHLGGHMNDVWKGKFLEIVNCIFASNDAFRRGGCMDCRDASMNFTNCTFIHNHANESGGAIASESTGDIIITNTTFVRNYISVLCTRGGGGALYIANVNPFPQLKLSSCIFIRNEVNETIKKCNGIIFFL
jgi:predicted outer membrane repeat protein